MLCCFLYELTYESPQRRSKIYKTELAKVFFSIVHFYIVAMILSNWLQTLRKFIIIQHRQYSKYEQLKKNPDAKLNAVKKEVEARFQ